MAYKDEYEVARLYSDGEFQRKLQNQFEGDYELRFNLAPPLFSKRDPNTGHLIKQEFGPWMMTAFSWLAKLRFLRGGRFDIFGYSLERRQERADIDEYTGLLDELAGRPDAAELRSRGGTGTASGKTARLRPRQGAQPGTARAAQGRAAAPAPRGSVPRRIAVHQRHRGEISSRLQGASC